jgi:hypothetical protein
VQKDRSDEVCMKCPSCGHESEAKAAEVPKPEVEVEYKEFKLAEFLEIRRKQGSPEAEEEGTVSAHGEPGAKEASPGGWDEKRRVAAVMALVFVVIVAIAGVFSLLRFFMK